MKKLLLLLSAVVITGCASNDYKAYAEAQMVAAQARADSDRARYAALAEIAKTGDAAAKVAAAMSLNMGAMQQPSTMMAAPKSWSETALGWASVLMPSLTQMYSSNRNAVVGVTQSNNSASVAISTNNTMSAIAGRIQAPGNVTTTNTTNSYNEDNTHTPTIVTQPTPIIVR